MNVLENVAVAVIPLDFVEVNMPDFDNLSATEKHKKCVAWEQEHGVDCWFETLSEFEDCLNRDEISVANSFIRFIDKTEL